MSLKTTLKIAENLFNDGFVVSKANLGVVYNVLSGETQHPPMEVVEILDFLCRFSDNLKSKKFKKDYAIGLN